MPRKLNAQFLMKLDELKTKHAKLRTDIEQFKSEIKEANLIDMTDEVSL